MQKPAYFLPLVALGATLLTTTVYAQTINGVGIEDFSTELVNGVNFDRAADYTIDGSGFEPNGTGTHSEVPDGSMWLTESSGIPAVITFDLESNFDLNSFTVWNYNEVGLSNRGTNDVEILVSDSVGGVFTTLGNFTFTQAPGNNTTDFGQVIDLSGFAAADDTRLIRFNITSNHGDAGGFAGLSEVCFDGAFLFGPVRILNLTPIQESSVAPDSNLVATFNQDIALTPGGTITLTDTDDGSGTVVFTLPDSQVSVSGSQLIIDPSSDLQIANYEVVIDGSAIESAELTPQIFSGTTAEQWTFSTFSLPPDAIVREVSGEGVIGDEVLTTNAGVATLDGQVDSNWRAIGGSTGSSADAFSSLVSPVINVPTTGNVTLSFTHRYNFEPNWDGGAVFISVNGGEASYVEPLAFSQNGYVGTVNDSVWPGDGVSGQSDAEVFHGQSADFDLPTLILSVADLGTLNAGDEITVEFRGGWDDNTSPAGTNWEIGTVTVEDSVSTPILDVDFTAGGTSGFTATTTAPAAFNGGWEYAAVDHIFEINADTLTSDRYAPDVPGSVIDLNGVDIVVELASGTLDAGDEFTLFDFTGGTTLTGSIGSITLPPGLWDSSTVALDGRIILLLPAGGGLTLGVDFEVDATVDDDGDDIWEELIGTSGYEFYLDTAGGVGRVSTTTSTQLSHAYDFPGDLPGTGEGTAGGAKLVLVGETGLDAECHSFNQVGYHSNDATLEFWIKPDNLTPAATSGQVIWEDGGGSGFGLFIGGGLITTSQDGGTDAVISYDVSTDPLGLLIAPATTEFMQIVLTRVGSTGLTEMFINGQSVGTATDAGGGGWSGGDGVGLGGRGEANVGGKGSGDAGTSSFDGQIALFRIYNQQILAQSEILGNFNRGVDGDLVAPTYLSLSPANLTPSFFAGDDLVATFTEDIALTGLGSITLRNLDTTTDTVISLSGADPDGEVTASGNQLTINPTGFLDYEANYAVLISSDAIVDLATTPNAFAGILDPARWTFTTDEEDVTPPDFTVLSPPDGSIEVDNNEVFSVAFNETVVLGTGNITFKNLTDSTEMVVDVTDGSQVSLADDILTITPTFFLGSTDNYAVRIDSGVVTDLTGNSFGGILDDTTWNFTVSSVLARFDLGTTTSAVAAGYEEVPVGVSSGNLTSISGTQNSITATVFANTVLDARDRGNSAGMDNETVNPGGSLSPLLKDFLFDGGNAEGETVVVEFTGLSANTSYEITSVHFEQSGGQLTFVTNWYEGSVAPENLLGTWNGNRDATVDETNFVRLDATSDETGKITLVAEGATGPLRLNGFIVELGGLPEYESWAALYPSADLSDPDGDFDGDGRTNDYERLFGLNPTNGSSVDPIVVPFDPVAGTFSFTRRDDALTGLFTDIETSTDLLMWTVDGGVTLDDSGGPAANGIETVQVTLSPGLLTAPDLFVRVNQNDGTVLSENFESDDGGFTLVGSPNDWEYGTPNSDNDFDLTVTAGNGGSSNCWATKLGAGGTPPAGVITPSADSILRSPNFSLAGATAAELEFAAAVDGASGDEIEVLIREVGTNNLVATVLPLGESPLTSITTVDWTSYGPIDISLAAGMNVYLEFRYQGGSNEFIGLYIDDVTVRKSGP